MQKDPTKQITHGDANLRTNELHNKLTNKLTSTTIHT